MKQYLESLKYCYQNGTDVDSRAGKVRKIFGYQMRFNLNEGFPAMTTKKLSWKSVTSELIWFLEGSDDERRLAEILYEDDRKNLSNKKTIWSLNADSNYWKKNAKFEGDVGRIYGVQWRDFQGVDQIVNLIKGIKENPNSRRHILSAWNPADLDELLGSNLLSLTEGQLKNISRRLPVNIHNYSPEELMKYIAIL